MHHFGRPCKHNARGMTCDSGMRGAALLRLIDDDDDLMTVATF